MKSYDPEKRYGYIEFGNGPDLFVYYTEIDHDPYEALDAGDRVTFDIFKTDKGQVAINVRKVPVSGQVGRTQTQEE